MNEIGKKLLFRNITRKVFDMVEMPNHIPKGSLYPYLLRTKTSVATGGMTVTLCRALEASIRVVWPEPFLPEVNRLNMKGD